ncbi:ultra-long-chain fatty acid omega-hydroxylase-like [Physella acuta]|uniref:ultra-long-chain fatty acid omega-hydroxylase-like n=1 Tax=Physella acuta TaxID=109671 RepID=UPI0027DDF91A|nr:ultra-long-chain fatty acid omega-hydroxylase-like [Physella acuta]
MIGLTLLFILATFCLWKYGRKYLAFRAFFNKFPGEKDFSYLYGNLHKYPGPNEEGIEYDFKMCTETKYFHRIWAGAFTPVILVYHPESVRPILKSSAPKPRDTLFATPYDMGVRWLGEGLLIANGAKWARNRRLLTPAFHFDILKPYVDVYNQCTDTLVSKIHELSKSGESFDLFQPVCMSTLDVILQCAFSYKSYCQTKGKNAYTTAMMQLMILWTDRSFKPQVFNEFIYGLTSDGKKFYKLCDEVHAVAEDIIEKRRKELENQKEDEKNTNKKVKDFLDTLLTARDEDGFGLSPIEIRNEVDTFLFEGHDTTASGVTWTLYRLAQHPEYQEMVYEEVLRVLDGREQLEWSDLSKLEFTTMCIKEGLRLDTAVPFIERKLEEDTQIMEYTIPKGTLVAVQIFVLHHNPHLWDRPHDFCPERFHPDKTRTMDPFQFLPFSAGSRNCIGQNFAMNEMKITIAKVIKNFKLTLDLNKPARRFTCATMKAENGVMVFAVPR